METIPAPATVSAVCAESHKSFLCISEGCFWHRYSVGSAATGSLHGAGDEVFHPRLCSLATTVLARATRFDTSRIDVGEAPGEIDAELHRHHASFITCNMYKLV